MAGWSKRRGIGRRSRGWQEPDVLDLGSHIRDATARTTANVGKYQRDEDVPTRRSRSGSTDEAPSPSSRAAAREARRASGDWGHDASWETAQEFATTAGQPAEERPSRDTGSERSRGRSRATAERTAPREARGGSSQRAAGRTDRPHNSRAATGGRPPSPPRAQRPPKTPGSRGAGSALARLGLVVVLLAVVAVGVFIFTRPASATIIATPGDASITFDGSVVGTGTLEVEDLKSGTYMVEVCRSGFATETATMEIARGKKVRLECALTPEPQTVSITTTPKGATCTIALPSGETTTAVTPLETSIPSGEITITLDLAGYNTFARTLFLDSPLTLEYNLDPEGQVLHGIGLITTLGAPKGVSVTPDGSEAWTSILDGPPSIQIFDPRTGEDLGEVDLGDHGAVEVIFNEAGTLAYTSQMETAKCFEIDVKTHTVLREFDAQSSWTKWVELSPDEKMLYASNWSGDDVSIIDLATGELVKRVRVSNTPRGMYATEDGKYLYVGGFDSGYLDRIDLATYEVTAIFKDGGALRHLVADEATGRLFISDMAEDVIWVHDMKTGATTKFADTDEKPNTIDLSPDGKMLFVSCRGENNPKSYYLVGPEWGSIIVYDTTTGKPLDALICGNQPTALDVSDDGALLIGSDFLDNRLRVYEVPGYETFAAAGGGRYEAHLAEITK